MARRNLNSSAARKNPDANDVPDVALVETLAQLWDYASTTDACVIDCNQDALADAIRYGFTLREASPATWEELLKHSLWKEYPKRRPKSDEQGDAPKFALAIFFGRSDRATKKTSDHWRAFQQLEHEGLSAAQIATELSKGEANVRSVCSRLAERHRQDAAALAGGTFARLGAPAIDESSGSAVTIGGNADASTRREAAIKKKAVRLNSPTGLPDQCDLAVDGIYQFTFKVLGGGGTGYDVKPLKIKRRKAK